MARFSKKKSYLTKNVFWFSVQLFSEKLLILKRIQRNTIINAHKSSCKVPLFLSDFNKAWIWGGGGRFLKNIKIPSFMEIHPVETQLFYADWRTGGHTERHMTKLIVAFRSFPVFLITNSFYHLTNHSYRLVSLMKGNCVLCEVWTGSLYTMQVDFDLKMLLTSYTTIITKYLLLFRATFLDIIIITPGVSFSTKSFHLARRKSLLPLTW